MRAIPEKNINEGEGLVGTDTPYSLNQHLFTFLKSLEFVINFYYPYRFM